MLLTCNEDNCPLLSRNGNQVNIMLPELHFQVTVESFGSKRRNQKKRFTSTITTKSTQLHGYGFRAEASGTIRYKFTSFSNNLDQTTLVKKRFIIWQRELFFPWTKEANPPVQKRSILPTWI